MPDDEIELMYSLWKLAVCRKEWFRDAKGTRMRIQQRFDLLGK